MNLNDYQVWTVVSPMSIAGGEFLALDDAQAEGFGSLVKRQHDGLYRSLAEFTLPIGSIIAFDPKNRPRSIERRCIVGGEGDIAPNWADARRVLRTVRGAQAAWRRMAERGFAYVDLQ